MNTSGIRRCPQRSALAPFSKDRSTAARGVGMGAEATASMFNPHAVVLTPNAKDVPKPPLEHGSEI
jgi:hypothetical protein